MAAVWPVVGVAVAAAVAAPVAEAEEVVVVVVAPVVALGEERSLERLDKEREMIILIKCLSIQSKDTNVFVFLHHIRVDRSSHLLSKDRIESPHLIDAVEELDQLLRRHVVDHVLQVIAVRAAASPAASALRRRIVDRVVDATTEVLVVVRLGLLHPEEEAPVGGLELEQVDAPRLALVHALKLTVVGEDDEVVLNNARGHVLPAKVDEHVLRLEHVQQPATLVRVHHLAHHVHAPGPELDQVAAI